MTTSLESGPRARWRRRSAVPDAGASDDSWLAAALERVGAAAPGRLAEPLAAFADRKEERGLTILSSQEVEGAVTVLNVTGERNVLFRGFRSRFSGRLGLQVTITGSDNVIFVGPYSSGGGTRIEIVGDRGVFYLGAFSSVGTMAVALGRGFDAGAGEVASGAAAPPADRTAGRIVFGDHCMMSSRVTVSNADSQAVFDRQTGRRINPNADVLVDDHVWIGREVRLGRGARIGRDAIVGQGAVVTGELQDGGVYCGIPVRQLREGITWSRMTCDSLQAMAQTGRHKNFLKSVASLEARIAEIAARPPPPKPTAPRPACTARIVALAAKIFGFRRSQTPS